MIATITDIQQILPHRPPFLFIDKVVDIKPSKSGTGIKLLTSNEELLTGNNMILPNVFHMEIMAQTSAIICAAGAGDDQNLGNGYLAGFDLQCLGQAVPGDILKAKVNIIKIWGAFILAEGIVLVDDREISKGRFTIGLKGLVQEP